MMLKIHFFNPIRISRNESIFSARRVLYSNSNWMKNKFQSNVSTTSWLLKYKIYGMTRNKLHYDTRILTTHTTKNIFQQKIIGYWLLTCSGMIFIAVTLGGLTRLTESGLSMVTWKFLGEPIPINEISWQNEFEKYKKFPEYQIINKNMTLEEFKRIWWMEYAHRMWGRLIGVVFTIPASYFWMKNMLEPTLKKKVLILGFLICCQGLMGWYMVKSGLVNKFDGPSDVPRVSQYRLAAHLSLAFVMYTSFLYTALHYLIPNNCKPVELSNSTTTQHLHQLRRFKFLVMSTKGLILLTAVSGAFVAGLDAGLIYNTFPKMCNKWIPDDILCITPKLKNLTENPTTVQFDHRFLALTTLTATTCIGIMSKKYQLPTRASLASITVLGTAYLQATLGILTLLNHIPTYLAAFHQSGSLLLLSAIVWLCHETKYIKKLPK